jgi:hypothetical protein
MQNALVISDNPMGDVSIFGDTCHREFGGAHWALPDALVEFMTGAPASKPSNVTRVQPMGCERAEAA